MSEAPIRIQRKRTKGWRMPENTIYVGRPTKYGNAFHVGSCKCKVGEICAKCFESIFWRDTPAECVEAYRISFKNPTRAAMMKEWAKELRGKNLACWCAIGQPCHADVLLELANASVTSSPEQEAEIESSEGRV